MVAEAERLARDAKYEAALAAFSQAAEIAKAGRQWGRYVHCLNGMAEQSRRLARLDEAAGFIDEAMKAGLEHLGERDLDVASSDARRADILYDQGDFEQAVRWHTRALALHLRLLGGQHPEAAASLAGRANARRSKGDFDEALAIQVAALGERHPDVGWTCNILGIIHSEKGQLDQAFAACGRAGRGP